MDFSNEEIRANRQAQKDKASDTTGNILKTFIIVRNKISFISNDHNI